SRKPIHLLDGMMPRVRSPHEIVAMLRAVNPIQNEIHNKERKDDFQSAGQTLQIMDGAGKKGRGDITDDTADEPGRDAVNRKRKSKGERVQFEIKPPVDRPGGPDALPCLEDEDQPK